MNARPPDMTAGAARVAAMAAGRRAETERRRQRVLKALETAAGTGEEISVSAIARRSGVDRTFLYPHRDLLAPGPRQRGPAVRPAGSRARRYPGLAAR
jgi:hypothetical protein